MWALYVFGGLALLLAAFLISDVCVDITYDHEFIIKAGLWRANRVLFPVELKKPKKTEQKEEEPEREQSEREEKPDLRGLAAKLRELFKLIRAALKKARLKPCKIHIIAASGDAAKTAILYGTCCAGLTTVQAALSELFGRFESDFSVLWDYESKETRVEVDLKVRIRVFWILVVVRSALFKYLTNPDDGLKSIFSSDKEEKKTKKSPKSP